MSEDPAFLREQLLTYLGNKRALLPFIGAAVDAVRARVGRERLRVWDAFGGSGAVSRALKRHASLLVFSDLEPYAAEGARCYLANRDDLDLAAIARARARVLSAWASPREGFIARRYAPRDDERVAAGERAFYTRENALRIDTFRQAIAEEDPALRPFLLAPLLAEASVHANTAGVFKGFYKDKRTGIGRFGGTNRDALSRIRGAITVPAPVFSRYACAVDVREGDARAIAPTLPELDLAYLDPPYNQHPYGSNYFMLNLILEYVEPEAVSAVSGIPPGWRRSAFNRAREAPNALDDVLRATPARHLLVSYNSEGFIGLEAMLDRLAAHGEVSTFERAYNTFRGCRNLRARNAHVTEYLFLVARR